MSTDSGGGVSQTAVEAVDGRRLGGFLVKFIPLENCSTVEGVLCAVGDAKMHLNLCLCHVVTSGA